MFSPSLITYTFFNDSSHKRVREASAYELSSLGIKPENLLNLSKAIGAFNFVFGGDSTSVPACSDSDLEIGEMLLSQNKIEVFCAGRMSIRGGVEWFYKGDILGVALVLADKLGVKIENKELNEVLLKLSGLDKRKIVIHEGFEKYDLDEVFFKCEEQGFQFDFIRKLKSKYSSYVRGGFFKRIFK